MDVFHRHAWQPCQALVAELAPRAMHAGLGMMTVAGNAFDSRLQQGGDALLSMCISWRGLDPDDLWCFGFHEKHQVK